MAIDSSRPFPLDVVRDLLGIARALYRATREATPEDARALSALEEIGRELRLALDLGKSGPGTLGSRAAWKRAEQATLALGTWVGEATPVGPALRATAAKIGISCS